MAVTVKVHVVFLVLAMWSIAVIAEEELKIEVTKEPPADCERKSQKGDKLSMHYHGTLAANGKKFDSSRDRDQPFDFAFGKGQVIQGWEQGLKDMCVGEQRRLTVPPHLAYGDGGFGDVIPPKSTLVFEVELMGIKDGGNDDENMEEPNMNQQDVFSEIDNDGDRTLSQDEVSAFLAKNEQMPEEEKVNLISEIFQQEDANKDGVISFDEFSGPKVQHDEF